MAAGVTVRYDVRDQLLWTRTALVQERRLVRDDSELARTPTPVHAPMVELLVMSFFTSAWQAGCRPRYSAAISDEVVAAAAAQRRTLSPMTSISNRLRKGPRRDLIERGRPRSVVKRVEEAGGSVARSHVLEDR